MSDYTNQLLSIIRQGKQGGTRSGSYYLGPGEQPTFKDAMGVGQQEFAQNQQLNQTEYDRKMQAEALARQAEQLQYDRGQTQRSQNMQTAQTALNWQNRGPGFSPNNDGSGMVNLPQKQMHPEFYGNANGIGQGGGGAPMQYVQPDYQNQANPYSPGVTNYLRQFFDSPQGSGGKNATIGTRG